MSIQKYTLDFPGRPGDVNDNKVWRTVRAFDGEVISAGTWLGEQPVRDVQFQVPSDKAEKLLEALRIAGFSPKAIKH